jgi:hypothetical protein
VTTLSPNRLACVIASIILGSVGSLHAQIELGTWMKKADSGKTALSMEVSRCCGTQGRRLTYHLLFGQQNHLMTVDSPMDGTEVPVLLDGKPIGETMAIKRLDPHHAFTVVKFNGKPFGTSKATLSPNGSTLTVDNDFTGSTGAQQAGKSTEVWLKQ